MRTLSSIAKTRTITGRTFLYLGVVLIIALEILSAVHATQGKRLFNPYDLQFIGIAIIVLTFGSYFNIWNVNGSDEITKFNPYYRITFIVVFMVLGVKASYFLGYYVHAVYNLVKGI